MTVVRDDRVDASRCRIDKPARHARPHAAGTAVRHHRRRATVGSSSSDGHVGRRSPCPAPGRSRPPSSFAGHVYCADPAAGIVYEFDGTGKLRQADSASQRRRGARTRGPRELPLHQRARRFHRPGRQRQARRQGGQQVRERGARRRPAAAAAADRGPPKPPITAPGRPQNVSASAGDETATHHVAPGARQRLGDHQVRRRGRGPVHHGRRQAALGRRSPGSDQRHDLHGSPCTRSTRWAPARRRTSPAGDARRADVPDAPASVTATAKPDGTVDVTWPAANGQGRKIVSYTVTSVSGGAQAPVGVVTGTDR